MTKLPGLYYSTNGGELNQVWTNHIDNAIDAVKGTGKICVGTSLEDNQVVVEIVDNGSGIPPEIQARIFEPFFTSKGIGSGTGFGSTLSRLGWWTHLRTRVTTTKPREDFTRVRDRFKSLRSAGILETRPARKR